MNKIGWDASGGPPFEDASVLNIKVLRILLNGLLFRYHLAMNQVEALMFGQQMLLLLSKELIL